MLTVQERVDALIIQYGGVRPAARVLKIDAGYLSRLANGRKKHPGKLLLRRLGLRRIVAYELKWR